MVEEVNKNSEEVTYLFDDYYWYEHFITECKREFDKYQKEEQDILKGNKKQDVYTDMWNDDGYEEKLLKDQLITYMACKQYKEKVQGFLEINIKCETYDTYKGMYGNNTVGKYILKNYEIKEELVNIDFYSVNKVILSELKKDSNYNTNKYIDSHEYKQIMMNVMFEYIKDYVVELYKKSYSELLHTLMDDLNKD